MTAPRVKGSAVLSECGRYRYSLTRSWEPASFGASVAWVMLNPSTADADVDDPTIRKCIGFSQRWGFSRLTVVNLFALRATDPRELLNADDPIGPANRDYVRSAIAASQLVVAAWGAIRRPHERIAPETQTIRTACLGLTRADHPRHPLYVPYETPLVEWFPIRGKEWA